jgi:hypothetical protein
MKKGLNPGIPPDLSSAPNEDRAAAIAEGVMVQQMLRDASSRPSTPMVTEQSVRHGAAIMAKFRRSSATALLKRIESGELITREELVKRLGGNRRWISSALKVSSLFSLQTPSGDNYFPAFYAASSIDRRAFSRVTKVLAGLPAASKYHFFLSKSFTLGMTPLEALAAGRVKETLTTAIGFATR